MKEERVGKSFTSLILDIFFSSLKRESKIHTRTRMCAVVRRRRVHYEYVIRCPKGCGGTVIITRVYVFFWHYSRHEDTVGVVVVFAPPVFSFDSTSSFLKCD